MNANTTDPAPGVYVPGYRTQKRLMMLGGLVIFLIGLIQLWGPLRLVLTGKRTEAAAFRVVKEKAGLPPIILTDDAQVRANHETHDHVYVFWNEFRFHTADGRVVQVRASVGSHLQPLYSLTDADGLPTAVPVFYDPHNPQHAVFPLIIAVWLIPGVLVFAGLTTVVVGSMLLYWADKPVVLPQFNAN